jgi:hypothetical protein
LSLQLDGPRNSEAGHNVLVLAIAAASSDVSIYDISTTPALLSHLLSSPPPMSYNDLIFWAHTISAHPSRDARAPLQAMALRFTRVRFVWPRKLTSIALALGELRLSMLDGRFFSAECSHHVMVARA